MLRDRDCNKRFERNLLHYVNLAKIAARKMHNNRMTNYVDLVRRMISTRLYLKLWVWLITIKPKQPVTFCHGFILSTI